MNNNKAWPRYNRVTTDCMHSWLHFCLFVFTAVTHVVLSSPTCKVMSQTVLFWWLSVPKNPTYYYYIIFECSFCTSVLKDTFNLNILQMKWRNCSECRWVVSIDFFLSPKVVCEKRPSKMKALPKEMLLSFSIGTFLTNYDVTIRKQEKGLIYSIVRKTTFWEQKLVNGYYYWPFELLMWKIKYA